LEDAMNALFITQTILAAQVVLMTISAKPQEAERSLDM
jgi:hypothetical protein